MDELAKLEVLAVLAKGEGKSWALELDEDSDHPDNATNVAKWPWRIAGVCNFAEEAAAYNIANFVAAFSPDVTLSLIQRLRTAEASAEAAKEQGRREEREAIITRIKHASVQTELLANQHSPTVSAMDRGAVRALDWLWRELQVREPKDGGGK